MGDVCTVRALLGNNANKVSGRMVQMWDLTSRFKHFMTMGVSATWWSCRQGMEGFLGTGTIVVCLRQDGLQTVSGRC